MGIIKRARNALTPFESEEHAREVMEIDEDLPTEEQERLLTEINDRHRGPRWRDGGR